MSVTGSASSHGTHSRSRSRSRSPPYSDGRYHPPRYPPRYDSYGYRQSRSAMSAALDDYREMRERDRDRERDRERERPPPPPLRDDRYIPRPRESRYAQYYRDDMPPPHHYSSPPPPSMSFRDYPKPPVRRDGSSERLKDVKLSTLSGFGSKDVKDEPRLPGSGMDSYTPSSTRYSDWRDRDRERDRDRDRRYRDDDRWGDLERRNRDRDSYAARDMMRYDMPTYGAPPPPSMPYPPPLFGGDSYRPDRDRDHNRDRERDMPPSPRGPPHMQYYDRDRLEDRYFDRRGPIPPDSERYRSRVPRSWVGSSNNGAGASGALAAKNRDRERERERETSIKSPRNTNAPAGTSSWAPLKSRDDEKLDPQQESTTDDKTHSDSAKIEKPSMAETENDTLDDVKHSQIIPTDSTKDMPENGAVLPVSSPHTVNKEETAETVEPQATMMDHDVQIPATSESKPVPATDNIEKDEKYDTIHRGIEQSTPSVPEEIAEKTITAAPKEEKDVEESTPSAENISQEVIRETKNTESQTTIEYHQKDNIEPIPVAASSSTPAVTSPSVTTSAHMPGSATPTESEPRQFQADENNVNEQILDKEITQQEIVERISQIENEISMYEDILEKREEQRRDAQREQEELTADATSENKEALVDVDDLEDEREITKEEKEAAQEQALRVISESSAGQTMAELENIYIKASPILRKKSQFLINQARTSDAADDMLIEKIIKDNQSTARENSCMVGGWQGRPDDPDNWPDEEAWSKPLYDHLNDYPGFKANVENFEKIKTVVAAHISTRQKALKRKELLLKREYKEFYKRWERKNLALDNLREHERRGSEKYTYRSTSSRRRIDEESEEYTDGVIFNSDHDALKFGNEGTGNASYSGPGSNGPWTSDTARSEAELLEIIQSLETADMRNPELRAAKTTATIPDMILDPKERMRTYDDRSGLVEDPLAYYHTGQNTGDIWTQTEMTAFMESYVQYPKQFDKIAAAVRTKTTPQCVLFYYRTKSRIDFKALVSKGRRGKGGKRKDRLAAAIRRATGGSTQTTRKAKSKGSALMADIGEAQVSRIAKEKESERKNRELRELEQANAYWDGVAERKRAKTKAPSTVPTSGGSAGSPASSAPVAPTSSSTDETTRDRRRLPRRKGRSPRAGSSVATVLPGEMDESLQDSMTEELEGEKSVAATAKWTEKDKESAVEAFKIHGRNFTQVATLVGTKTEDQCRNFYHNFKRKYGPHIFDEESDEASSDIQTYGGRPVLKSEEDAAAALMGMRRMSDRDKSPSFTTGGHARTLSMQMDDSETQQSRSSISTTSTPGQRRRRVRTSSGKAEEEGQSGWSDAEAGPRAGRRPGRTPQSATSSETRRPAFSSYWSVSERNDFKRYLEIHGRDWEKLAAALKSKTATQVRNYYANNEAKMGLDAIVQEHNRTHRKETPSLSNTTFSPPTHPGDGYHAMYEDSTSTKSHFQPIQNIPYTTSTVPDAKTSSHSPYPVAMGPRIGYFTPSPPAHASSALPPSGMMHSYGPTSYASPQRPSHLHGSPQAPSSHFSPVSTGPQRIHDSDRSTQPFQPTSILPSHFKASSSQSAPSPVTKVADLLNNEESGETTEKRDWKSWFGS